MTRIPGAIERKMGQTVKSLDCASQSLDFILWVAGSWQRLAFKQCLAEKELMF